MKLPLTQRQFALIDTVTPQIEKYRWHAAESKGKYYARATVNGLPLYLSAVLYPKRKDQKLCYLNGNQLDLRSSNVLIVSVSHARQRREYQRTCRGVCWHKTKKRWRATIMRSGKRHQIGEYREKKDALRAYNDAAVELYGKLAVLNKL